EVTRKSERLALIRSLDENRRFGALEVRALCTRRIRLPAIRPERLDFNLRTSVLTRSNGPEVELARGTLGNLILRQVDDERTIVDDRFALTTFDLRFVHQEAHARENQIAPRR